MLEVKNKDIYVIDYDLDSPIHKVTDERFNAYIIKIINYIKDNNDIRLYKSRSQNTQIVSSSCKIVNAYLENTEKKDEFISLNFKENAERLIRVEKEIQEKISGMKNNVKKGSLIQALAYDNETCQYLFLLAKIERSGFYDEFDFSEKVGFSSDTDRIWKTCLFSYDNDDEIEVDVAKVFLDNPAKYWADKFLELEEVNGDDENTSKMFKGLERVLINSVKNESVKDFWTLRNATVVYLKSHELFDYSIMINTIFETYQPEELEMDKFEQVLIRIRNLPEEKKFDTQFNIVKSVLKARIKKIIPVNDGIEIRIFDGIENFSESIFSEEDNLTGEMFIKIKTNNEETYNAFKK